MATAAISASMLTMIAAPAVAFVHANVPAEECSPSSQAGENPTARDAIIFKNPAQNPPVGNAAAPTPEACQ